MKRLIFTRGALIVGGLVFWLAVGLGWFFTCDSGRLPVEAGREAAPCSHAREVEPGVPFL